MKKASGKKKAVKKAARRKQAGSSRKRLTPGEEARGLSVAAD